MKERKAQPSQESQSSPRSSHGEVATDGETTTKSEYRDKKRSQPKRESKKPSKRKKTKDEAELNQYVKIKLPASIEPQSDGTYNWKACVLYRPKFTYDFASKNFGQQPKNSRHEPVTSSAFGPVSEKTEKHADSTDDESMRNVSIHRSFPLPSVNVKEKMEALQSSWTQHWHLVEDSIDVAGFDEELEMPSSLARDVSSLKDTLHHKSFNHGRYTETYATLRDHSLSYKLVYFFPADLDLDSLEFFQIYMDLDYANSKLESERSNFVFQTSKNSCSYSTASGAPTFGSHLLSTMTDSPTKKEELLSSGTPSNQKFSVAESPIQNQRVDLGSSVDTQTPEPSSVSIGSRCSNTLLKPCPTDESIDHYDHSDALNSPHVTAGDASNLSSTPCSPATAPKLHSISSMPTTIVTDPRASIVNSTVTSLHMSPCLSPIEVLTRNSLSNDQSDLPPPLLKESRIHQPENPPFLRRTSTRKSGTSSVGSSPSNECKNANTQPSDQSIELHGLTGNYGLLRRGETFRLWKTPIKEGEILRVMFCADNSRPYFVEEEEFQLFHLATIKVALKKILQAPPIASNLSTVHLAHYAPNLFWNLVFRFDCDPHAIRTFLANFTGGSCTSRALRVRRSTLKAPPLLAEDRFRKREDAEEVYERKENFSLELEERRRQFLAKQEEVFVALQQDALERVDLYDSKRRREATERFADISSYALPDDTEFKFSSAREYLSRRRRERRTVKPKSPERVVLEYMDEDGFPLSCLSLIPLSLRKMVYGFCCMNEWNAPLWIRKNEKGRAVYAAKHIQKDDFICEYIGDYIHTTTIARMKEKLYEQEGLGSYMFYFRNPYSGIMCCIDSTEEKYQFGCARLINHSHKCPNCVAMAIRNPQESSVNLRSEPKLIFVARTFIKKGDELLIDYGETNAAVLKANPWLLNT